MGQLSIQDTVAIPNTGVSMPRLGLGVYQLYGQACRDAVLAALAAGFRHVDSAQVYRNEADVGAALQQQQQQQQQQQTPVRRQDVFLTTKMSPPAAAGDPERTYRSALDSIAKIGGGDGGYVDLLLVHVPGSSREARKQLWETLERLHDEGHAKAIGVSNFRVQHLEEMKQYARVWPPHVNQLERDLVRFCHDNAIVLQAYSPLSCGENLDDKTLARVAAKHARSPAQVLIRYGLQKNWVPLPKSGNPDRIKQNAAVFDFALDRDDMEALDSLDKGPAGALFPANVK